VFFKKELFGILAVQKLEQEQKKSMKPPAMQANFKRMFSLSVEWLCG